jgi:allantoin racemase
VLALEERNTDALGRISAEITAAMRDDRAEAIVLGCAGMADLAAELATAHALPVVDGVAAAVTLAEGMVRLGLRTSRLGPYAAPRSKPYLGPFSRFQP